MPQRTNTGIWSCSQVLIRRWNVATLGRGKQLCHIWTQHSYMCTISNMNKNTEKSITFALAQHVKYLSKKKKKLRKCLAKFTKIAHFRSVLIIKPSLIIITFDNKNTTSVCSLLYSACFGSRHVQAWRVSRNIWEYTVSTHTFGKHLHTQTGAGSAAAAATWQTSHKVREAKSFSQGLSKG